MEVISSAMFSSDRRFLFAHFEYARLVLYSDANSLAVLQREGFKMISSGGRGEVPINRKGEMAYRGKIVAQMAVASNYQPIIRNENHSRSRILLIEIAPLTGPKDPRIEEKLKPELPGFLAYCEAAYREVCRDDYLICVDAAVAQQVDRQAAEDDDRHQNLIES